MYEIIKSVISSKRYELSDILTKIDKIWIQGDITEEERSELVSFAQENADPMKSYAPIQQQIDELFKNMQELAKEIRDLKHGQVSVEETETEEYPEYKQPIGAHDAYHAGDKVTYREKKYICTAPEGIAVVWPPSSYPIYWQFVDDTES